MFFVHMQAQKTEARLRVLVNKDIMRLLIIRNTRVDIFLGTYSRKPEAETLELNILHLKQVHKNSSNEHA